MKAIGIVRRLDDLGRIVIPKETRRVLNIIEGDSLEIYVDGENIILKAYKPGCNCCGTISKDLKKVNNITLCEDCVCKFK